MSDEVERLNAQEIKFVSYYIETGDLTKAVKMAGYKSNSPHAYGRKLLSKPKIQEELQDQLASFRNECVANNVEIMQFFTKAMRGEVKDQFGLDATLADRMKAAESLAKRQIDIQQMMEKSKEQEIKVRIFFGDEESNNEE